jgi:aspartyl-tRNA(Asn)/glutamyl-tRNA(Gln) amidotransferase subunit C
MAGLDPAIQTRCLDARLKAGHDEALVRYWLQCSKGEFMSVDQATVRRIAHLARIKVSEHDVPHLQTELNAILAFVEELSGVDVEGVEPMTSVQPMPMKKREDVVTEGAIADKIVANAPVSDDHFFVVPKVVE